VSALRVDEDGDGLVGRGREGQQLPHHVGGASFWLISPLMMSVRDSKQALADAVRERRDGTLAGGHLRGFLRLLLRIEFRVLGRHLTDSLCGSRP
jgi:hypothetical protein